MSTVALFHYLTSNPFYLYSLLRYKYLLRSRFKWIQKNATTNKKVPPPLVYKLIVTEKCNLSCKMCMNIDDHNNPNTTKKNREIDFLLVKDIVDQVASTQPSFIISGGEPMIYSHFEELIILLDNKKIKTDICTNGTFIKNHISLLEKTKNINLIVSLDGNKKENDSIRGNGVYEKVTEGIKKLRERSKRIFIGIQHTIMPENVNSLYLFCKKMIELKVDWILLNPCWCLPEEQAIEYVKFIKEYYNIKAKSHLGYLINYSIDYNAFAKEYSKIKKEKWPIQISCYLNNPPLDLKKINEDYRYYCNNKFCYKQWIRMDIISDGKVVSCQQYPDIILGDLNKESCLTIWNSESFRNFRNIILKSSLPVCNKCAPIYLYDKKRYYL